MGPTSNLVVNGIVEQIPPLSIYPSWNSWKPRIKGLKRLFSRTPAKKFGVTTQVSCVNLAGLENPQWEQKILEAFRSCACWKLCHCPVTVHPQPPHIKYPLWVAAPKFIVPVPNQGCLWLLGILIYVCVIILISIKRVIRNNKKKNDIHIYRLCRYTILLGKGLSNLSATLDRQKTPGLQSQTSAKVGAGAWRCMAGSFGSLVEGRPELDLYVTNGLCFFLCIFHIIRL